MEDPDPFAKFMKHQKQRAKSISNAVLANLRLKGKHVSFNDDGDVVFIASSNDSSPLSNTSTDSEGDDIEYSPREVSPMSPNKKPVDESKGAKSPKFLSAHNNLLELKRFRSHPHQSTYMAQAALLDTRYFSPQHSNLNLPEFNKRPLTDTPIVSSVASPVTQEQLSDSETEECDDSADNAAPGIRRSSSKSKSKSPIHKTKNISHLSLVDLNAVSAAVVSARAADISSDGISPTNTSEGTIAVEPELDSVMKDDAGAPTKAIPDILREPLKAPQKAPLEAKGDGEAPKLSYPTFTVSPSSEPSDVDTPSPGSSTPKASKSLDAAILRQIKKDLLPDVPEDLQLQFEKTPSFEKLKNMLLLKPIPKPQKAYTLNIAGQTSSKISPDGRIASVDVGSKMVIVMVGLPARGKSYITNKLTRYLNWLQHDCRVFNVGNTRRMDKTNVLGPASSPLPDTNTPLPHAGRSPEVKPLSPAAHSADFFNPKNANSTELREKWAMDTLDNLLNWVVDGPGSVGILDATNSTKKRRIKVLKRIQERTNGELKVLFLESICSDPAILDTNIRLKLSGPDYKDMDPEVALKDFIGRLRNYESAYETIDESEESIPGYQYVKMIDVGKKVVSYNVQGFLASQTIYFLLNFNLCERQIWLTRHGESIDNLSGRIGGDSALTKRGQRFAKTLSRFLSYQRRVFRKKQLENFSSRLELHYNELTGKASGTGLQESLLLAHIPTEPNFCVWTSMLLRAIETGNYFNDQEYNVKAMRMLNELGGGKYDGMTYDEIRRKHPKEFESRIKNKLTYRYPGVGGESYLDVLVRLRPVINEIERTTDHLLIVSHRVVLRVLLAYFLNLDKSAIVELDVPLHTLYCLELKPYGTEYAMYEYDETSDWFKKVEPEHRKNVKEVGVNFRERKYSVIPTAPPSSSGSKKIRPSIDGRLGSFSVRKSISTSTQIPTIDELSGDSGQRVVNSSSSRKLADLSKMRKP
ncbi:CIC11C00000004553 [Sungouiella intermedia]|uniref:CIC11C00000004553 n=1 Tax=Sungouiella intermedia TaxID=45354 RepID=A0A1L0C1U4_9ASCO|nr:CIC11C00000004553 [[Candida] intermedia]